MKPTIVAVDDNPSNITLLEQILSDIYHVITFYNPLEVIEYMNHSKAQLILADLIMPEMNGIELMKTVKKSHPYLPFIIISAYDEHHDIQKAYDNGVYKYLIKPIDIPHLFETIEKALRIS